MKNLLLQRKRSKFLRSAGEFPTFLKSGVTFNCRGQGTINIPLRHVAVGGRGKQYSQTKRLDCCRCNFTFILQVAKKDSTQKELHPICKIMMKFIKGRFEVYSRSFKVKS